MIVFSRFFLVLNYIDIFKKKNVIPLKVIKMTLLKGLKLKILDKSINQIVEPFD